MVRFQERLYYDNTCTYYRALAVRPQRVCTLRSEVAGLVSESLGKAFPGLKEEPLVAATAQPKFGDYQCNNAMSLFGKLKGQEGAPKVREP